jgi:hypothetical protein
MRQKEAPPYGRAFGIVLVISNFQFMKNAYIFYYVGAALFAIGGILSFIEGGFLVGALGILACVGLYLIAAKEKSKPE